MSFKTKDDGQVLLYAVSAVNLESTYSYMGIDCLVPS